MRNLSDGQLPLAVHLQLQAAEATVLMLRTKGPF